LKIKFQAKKATKTGIIKKSRKTEGKKTGINPVLVADWGDCWELLYKIKHLV
jgi:hypothetical protein